MNTETKNSTLIQETASNKIARLFTQSVRIIKLYEQQSLSSAHIEETESFAELLLETLKLYPHQTTAQLTLHRSKAPYFHNFLFNTCIYAGLCLLRNKMNLTTAQQIIAGIFSWIVTSRGYLESLDRGTKIPNHAYEAIKVKLRKGLHHFKRTIWLDILESQSGRILSSPKTWLQYRDLKNPTHDYLKHSVFIALQITRSKNRRAISYTAALRSLVQNSHCFAMPVIEPLLEFPGEVLPGSAVKIATGHNFLILGIFKNECYSLPYDATSRHYGSDIKLITKDQIAVVMPATPVSSLKLMDKWWGRPWKDLLLNLEIKPESLITPASYRIDHPPESLTNVIQHLNENDLDIPKLTQLIESEQGFAEHIKQTASHKSRAKMKISDVKHGLLMNGIDRTKSVLLEKALVTRLTQHLFPLQTVLYQFVKLWASFAESIAQLHPRMLPEECSCWVHFAASGLFTNAEIKSQFAWQMGLDNCEHGIRVANTETLWQHSHKISQSWSQERELTGALKDVIAKRSLPARVKRSQPHALISLSLLLTTRYFLAQDQEKPDEEYLQQYLTCLGLDLESLAEITTKTTENSHTYWPIHNQLLSING